MRELDVALHGVDLADKAGERGARCEARDDEEFVIVENIHEAGSLVSGGGPELGLYVEVPCKGRGHDADDGVGLRIEIDGFADDVRDRRRSGASRKSWKGWRWRRGGLVVGSEEVAAERGRDAEDAEEIPGYPRGGDRLRQLAAAGGDVVALPGRNEGHLRGGLWVARCHSWNTPPATGSQGVGLLLTVSLS